MFSGDRMKCPYYDRCKMYDTQSHTCNETDGFFGERESGCYKEWKYKSK